MYIAYTLYKCKIKSCKLCIQVNVSMINMCKKISSSAKLITQKEII